jgi:hypothetical protein
MHKAQGSIASTTKILKKEEKEKQKLTTTKAPCFFSSVFSQRQKFKVNSIPHLICILIFLFCYPELLVF